MHPEHKKGIDEIAVFFRFLKEANLPVALESVEKRVPPEPDLVCVHASEGAVAVEVVELCDSNLARAFAKADDGYIRTSDPSARIVAKKLRRKYRTTLPVELLCYTAGRIITPDNVILPTIKPFLRSWRHIAGLGCLVERACIRYGDWSNNCVCVNVNIPKPVADVRGAHENR
jgi:hypothetical protein